MFWRLTMWGAIAIFFTRAACGQTVPTGAPRAVAAPPEKNLTLTIRWEQLPLADAVARLNDGGQVAVFVDRRVDPSQTIDLSIDDASIDEIAARVAAACSLGSSRMGNLIYIGPRDVAERLSALAEQRRRELARLPVEQRTALAQRVAVRWPRLSGPRALVTQLLQEHGWQSANPEQIPHDLWPAGALPKASLPDQLTVLLAGFDLTYRVSAGKPTIEFVPIEWKDIEPLPSHVEGKENARAPRKSGKQVYTLRVEQQPVGKILEELARRTDWKLDVDEAGIRAAGRSLDQRVSFSVENVDAEGLLQALLMPAGLKAERQGERIKIGPR